MVYAAGLVAGALLWRLRAGSVPTTAVAPWRLLAGGILAGFGAGLWPLGWSVLGLSAGAWLHGLYASRRSF